MISTCDYLVSSNQIELRSLKPCTTPNQPKSMCDQIQKLSNLYKSRPRYGPESCEDCLNLMCLLKPIELYFDTPGNDFSTGKLAIPYPQSGASDSERTLLDTMKNVVAPPLRHTDDSALDHNEDELRAYNSKLNKYLDEMPTNCNDKLELTSGKFFGMVVAQTHIYYPPAIVMHRC